MDTYCQDSPWNLITCLKKFDLPGSSFRLSRAALVSICFALERIVSHKREQSISLNNHGVEIFWIMCLDMIMLMYIIAI